MAHLTISLGAKLVVPFRFSRGWNGHRGAGVRHAHIRWRSFCEAAIAAVDRSEIKRSLSLYSTRNPHRLRGPDARKDIW